MDYPYPTAASLRVIRRIPRYNSKRGSKRGRGPFSRLNRHPAAGVAGGHLNLKMGIFSPGAKMTRSPPVVSGLVFVKGAGLGATGSMARLPS